MRPRRIICALQQGCAGCELDASDLGSRPAPCSAPAYRRAPHECATRCDGCVSALGPPCEEGDEVAVEVQGGELPRPEIRVADAVPRDRVENVGRGELRVEVVDTGRDDP